MADDFFDSIPDDIFEDFPFPTAVSAFGASPFHRLGAFAPPAEIGFGGLCPRRLVAGNPSSIFDVGSASSPFSSATPATRFGIGHPPLCPAHPANRPRVHPSQLPPVPHPILPSLSSLRNPSDAGSSTAAADPFSRLSWNLPTFLGRASTPGQREANSDDYLINEIATGNYSSPSIFGENTREHNTTANAAPVSSPWQRVSATLPSTITDGPPSGSGVKNEPSLETQILPSSDSFEMPARQGTGTAGARRSGGHKPPAQTESSSTTRKRKLTDILKSEDDIFGEDFHVIDLANTEEVPVSLVPQKPKNEVKLSKFQCVICMDDSSSLTVTHCGHLFCGECLHSSLHIDASKKICPICRQKVESRPASGKFGVKAKGYYPLQPKMTTRKSLGKRIANS